MSFLGENHPRMTELFEFRGCCLNQTPVENTSCCHLAAKISKTTKRCRIKQENHNFIVPTVSVIRKISTVYSSVCLLPEEQASSDLVTTPQRVN